MRPNLGQKSARQSAPPANRRRARNREAFTAALAAEGPTLYQRGRSVGVQTEGGRRYRFRTLGLAEAYTEAVARFELVESRMGALGWVRRERGQ